MYPIQSHALSNILLVVLKGYVCMAISMGFGDLSNIHLEWIFMVYIWRILFGGVIEFAIECYFISCWLFIICDYFFEDL